MGVKLQSSSGGSVEIAAPITASNYVLTAPAKTATLLTTASTGTVLQVVSATYSTETSTTSTSFVSTGLTASITPSSSTSKILVLFSVDLYSPSGVNAIVTVFRGSTAGTNISAGYGFGARYGGSDGKGLVSGAPVDSPATTSSQLYTVAFRSGSGGSVYAHSNNATSTITLMEIAG